MLLSLTPDNLDMVSAEEMQDIDEGLVEEIIKLRHELVMEAQHVCIVLAMETQGFHMALLIKNIWC